MPILDVGLRGGAVALLLFLAIVLLRDGWPVRAARYTGIFVLSSIGFAVASAPELTREVSPWLVPFQIGMFGDPALLWPLAAAVFDDNFRPDWRHGLAWLVLVALGFACRFTQLPAFGLAATLLNIACIGLAVWQAVSGRAEDLVEGRRRLRAVFVCAVGFSAIADVLIDLVMEGGPAPLAVDLARLVLLVAVTVTFGLAMLGMLRDGPVLSLIPAEAIQPVASPPEPVAAELPDAATLAALDELMEQQRCYREEGLTIAALAARLGMPEYRLRRVINQGLQYRNFSEFLNRYRLADVTAALSDPTQDEVPILTIALDAGFGSLGPFNRAFKAHTGVTPTEFRRARHARPALKLAVSETAFADSESGEPSSPIPLRVMPRRSTLQPRL